ncbi:uncharacterized protein LOC114946200 [Nylanderia fulva]|uniref:uncharacterized protein LOC114946200 n=1 Tax=Nylanderia fulva TaxID=613905 RepID=UPI0010FBB68E|nr:uncharacterized protein LOC114946200 [Nylanderia fulva]XP_029178464.1 uncharacterized protein LOC114946200 [Nylanderia fulva]XP_029178465.1 uncharacterized protein LOC114946200 [Nylanderia fulva]XP_029178466.1 uncharacterized protein LOC114946200 [Nylanderia fulva]XP_029178467.1 uncharacterized protein LOC114946200 [Nylanderia fulva]XP_029178469.1 uncharacterized protein LOC114946200 [Nylanderia fulva]XP_029178470.1 uncharacterized protein LOC114946200 [Nylanderia fulva]XP_029178471.1 unc
MESVYWVTSRNKSGAKMEISISSVESYSTKDETTDSRQTMSPSSSSMRNVRNNISLGISTIVATSTSTSQESSVNVTSSIQLCPSKRACENDVSSVDSTTDSQNPLAVKRQKGWYSTIKGRQPIKRTYKSTSTQTE